MELGTYVDDLQRQLAVAAAAGGDDARELAERLTAPLDAAARLVLLEALSAAAGEITLELAPGSVDLRLRGREPEFVVTQATPAPEEADASAGQSEASASGSARVLTEGEEGATSRTTLRLPDELKARVEAAAAQSGVSVNTWLVRAVASVLDTAARRTPHETRGGRVKGWVR